jgi:tetratricopeptide (TPR) repeat protein
MSAYCTTAAWSDSPPKAACMLAKLGIRMSPVFIALVKAYLRPSVQMRSGWISKANSYQVWLASMALFLFGWTGPLAAHPELTVQTEQLDEALSDQPENPELLIRRGDIHRREGNFVAAEQDFASARLLEPANPELDFYQGRLLLDMGRPEEADGLLGHWLDYHPESATAWALRGDARMQMNQPLAAAEAYTQAIALSDTPSPGIYLLQANALRQAGPEHRQQAFSAIDSALEKFPTEVSLLGLGVDMALESGQPELAQKYFERVATAIRKLPPWQARAAQLSPQL